LRFDSESLAIDKTHVRDFGPPPPRTCRTNEAAVWGNWTWKAEYLYVDLGSVAQMGVVLGVACAPCLVPHPVSGGQTTAHTHFTDNIIRMGLNYKFY